MNGLHPDSEKFYNTAEYKRLKEDDCHQKHWKRWGPYLSERNWGTVREDYSSNGDTWNYFSHNDARSRAYRWGEDGLLGICDSQCRLCFALALWNEKDSILKERLFGLTGSQGNHGEDVKELYYYLDATPTSSYLKALYKYPQAAYPYSSLIEENQKRGLQEPEFEICDTGVFNDNRYFDVFAEYAKADANDILIKITLFNRGPESASLHILPTLWFRNTWIWGSKHEGSTQKPNIRLKGNQILELRHETLQNFELAIDRDSDGHLPSFLFTDNHTNSEKLFGSPNITPYVKDAFHEYIIHGKKTAVNPNQSGTKAAACFFSKIPSGKSLILRFRLYSTQENSNPLQNLFDENFEKIFTQRIQEADSYYDSIANNTLNSEEKNIQRQGRACLLWNNQFYHYSVLDWIKGDPGVPPPSERLQGRNRDWTHLFNRDVVNMPDKWEYPYYCAWDLAFNLIPFAKIDPYFAKQQLLLFMREWYMHPNGQIPAYEFAFSDVNPPVHAWSAWRIYKMSAKRGERDLKFLAQVFHKLLINFTWWVNRKDPHGNNLFSGGFLGMDNIGAFDRSQPLPDGAILQQADGTAWMAFYCSTMLSIALELAHHNAAYEGVASKFFEHFVAIVNSINQLGRSGLWNEEDGFYYDHLIVNGKSSPLKIRSMVGLIPLYAVEVFDQEIIDTLPSFKKRMKWFLKYRKDILEHAACMIPSQGDVDKRYLFAISPKERLERVLRYVLDENEFLSDYGIRSLSKIYKDHPFKLHFENRDHHVKYVSAESDSYMFGGNSNWRGPIWIPVNFLLLESLEKYYYFYGNSLKVEFPTNSGNYINLNQVAQNIACRIVKAFLPDNQGHRPIYGHDLRYAKDPYFKNLVHFFEYLDGDCGRGAGSCHQSWSCLVIKLLDDLGHIR